MLTLLLLVFYWPQTGLSQRDMHGKVLDSNGHPISDVQVIVKGVRVVPVTSNEQGEFTIFAPLRQLLVLKKKGYKSKSLKITEGLSLEQVFQLEEKIPSADKIVLKGQILVEPEGEALIGASVIEKGTTNSTVTDLEGRFELELNRGATILMPLNCFGPNPEYTIEKGGERIFNIDLDGQDWDRVVFGNQTLLERKDFNVGNLHHPLELIQGRVPGTMISMGGGNNPFGVHSVRLHGLATFDDRGPLIVVDGIPNATAKLIDPLEIESIRVLRDGSAGLYGIQGANGVIEISTKNTKDHFSGIRYEAYAGIDRLHLTMDFFDAQGFIDAGGDPDLGHQTNWFEAITDDAISHAHHLSLTSELGPNTRYKISGNFREANGILKNQGFQRVQLNAHLSQKALRDKLEINGQLLFREQENDFSNPFAMRYAQTINPTAPIFEPERRSGYFSPNLYDYYNPVEMIDLTEHVGTNKDLLTNLSLRYELTEGLSITGNYSSLHNVADEGAYVSRNTSWRSGDWYNGYAEQKSDQRDLQMYGVRLTYQKRMGRLESRLQLGHQYQSISFENLFAAGGDFLTDAFSFHNLAAANDFQRGNGQAQSFQSKYQVASYFARLEANWDEIIFVQAGWRYEGSSRLGKNNLWGNFPFVSLQWHAHQQLGGFVRSSNLQLRSSFGITGNLPSQSLLSQRIFGESTAFLQSGEFLPSYTLVNTPNPDLKWEEKVAWSFGADVKGQIFDRPYEAGLTVYSNRIQDILRDVNLNFLATEWLNLGGLRNNGVEVYLNYTPVNNHRLTWSSNLLISANKTTLEQYFHPNDYGQPYFSPFERTGVPFSGCCKRPTVKLEHGEEIGGIWVLKNEGIDSDGRWIFADLNRNGITEDTEDVYNAGNGLPNWTLGWNNNVSWRNFDLQFLFRGAFGHSNFNITQKISGIPSALYAQHNALTSARSGELARLWDFAQESDRYVQKASYLRLENLSVGYTFDTEKVAALSSLRLYVAGQNLLTFSGYQGWDPEYRLVSGSHVFAPGYEHRTLYLPTKSFVFGFQVGIK